MDEIQQQFSGMPRRLYAASPSRLLAWLDCPRRYRMQYLDRPKPVAWAQRAQTSIGVATHNVLRDFWDLPTAERTPTGVQRLVGQLWIDVGFRDSDQSAQWRHRTTERVTHTGRAPPSADRRGSDARAHAAVPAAQGRRGRVDRLRPVHGRRRPCRQGRRVAALRAEDLTDLHLV